MTNFMEKVFIRGQAVLSMMESQWMDGVKSGEGAFVCWPNGNKYM